MIILNKSPQEMLDTFLIGAAEQKGRCVDSEGNCYYRYNGRKCAIGMLIPDEAYDPEIEGNSIFMLTNSGAVIANDREFIADLQWCHDASTSLQDLHTKIKWLAGKHNLNTALLENVTEWEKN